jgi:hypothetical protein
MRSRRADARLPIHRGGQHDEPFPRCAPAQSRSRAFRAPASHRLVEHVGSGGVGREACRADREGKAVHRRALGLDAEPRSALPISRNPVIRNDVAHQTRSIQTLYHRLQFVWSTNSATTLLCSPNSYEGGTNGERTGKTGAAEAACNYIAYSRLFTRRDPRDLLSRPVQPLPV